ncbi:unnamed protein product [Phyllotreta striolata]|uniref:Equilibrative nucleoside transporter 3 n=1 Tax=Phyllotreta striolata TaxID=444603 RepID=A0A9N9XNX1_PHYSR|nr:unnamed protein product [Phyllotreta striolata]
MAYSVNTTPLLYSTQLDSDEEDIVEINGRDNKPLLKTQEPRDKFYGAYLTFYLLGIVSLLPWNFFITADDYWMYKFRNVSSNVSIREDAPSRNTLQAEFTSYLNLASCYPNLIMLIFSTVIIEKVSLYKRVLIPLVITLFLMMLTLVFVNLNTDKWQELFLWLTLFITLLLNIVTPIFGGSVTGIVGKFSPTYITAVVGGQSLGGIFAALTQIAALAIGASSTHSALVYFIIGNLTIVLAIVSFVYLAKSAFFNFYVRDQHVVSNIQSTESIQLQAVSYKLVFKKIWAYCVCVFITFFITISLFPGVMVLIESEGKGQGSRWSDTYFVPTITYLLFNFGDYIGRLVACKVIKPKSITLITIFTLTRIIFIPLILLCNCHPRHHLAVVFDKDYYYVIICFIFAFTNGYLMNLTSILTPRIVDHHEKEIASLITVVFVASGAAVGSSISLFIIRLL